MSWKFPFAPQAGATTFFRKNQEIEQTDCLVLGAGLSGLTAARNLAFSKEHTPLKVIVLEATGGVGGRIYSINDPRFSEPMELGASYLHRKPDSVDLWDEIDRYNIEVQKIPRMLKGRIYVPAAEHPLRKEFMLPFKWSLKDIAVFFRRIDHYRGPNISAKEWLDRQNYNDTIKSIVNLALTGHIPGKLEELSLRGFSLDQTVEQELEWNEYKLEGGLSSFVDHFKFNDDLSQQLDIRYQSIVQQIKYGPAGVEVRVQDGKIYKAKSAILTFPVGVLKSGAIEFIPPLPKSKTDALECLGMGDEAKIILKFKRCFWGKDTAFLNSTNQKRKTCRTFFIPGYGKSTERNTVLSALFVGAEADKIHDQADASVILDICSDLSEIFPDEGPIDQLLELDSTGYYQYLRMHWRDNPYSLGADSFLKAHSEKSIPLEKVRQTLASSEETPGLFWAGEATVFGDDIQPGSMHGAYFSGKKVSAEVFDKLTKF